MCLYANGSTLIRVAKEDIEVFKVLTKKIEKFHSPIYKKMIWDLDKLYQVDMCATVIEENSIMGIEKICGNSFYKLFTHDDEKLRRFILEETKFLETNDGIEFKEYWRNWVGSSEKVLEFRVNAGLHSFADKRHAEHYAMDWIDNQYWHYVFKAIIPKGAFYIKEQQTILPNLEIVSTQLILKEKLSHFNC